MASSFFSSPPFLSLPTTTRGNYLSSSSSSSSQSPTPPPTPPPPPSNNNLPPPAPVPTQQLSSRSTEPPAPSSAAAKGAEQRRTSAESTDWIASTLTRRFGIGAGLAWVAFLAVGVVSEQIKTRLEVSREEATTRDVEKEEEVVMPNGIRYYEMRVGGGSSPQTGDLVVINVKGSVQGSGQVFINTYENRAIALVLGSRPYGKGICEGMEDVLRSMKAGGKRRVFVPSKLGFGEEGADLGEGLQIPPSATLEYVVELQKVSIAPS